MATKRIKLEGSREFLATLKRLQVEALGALGPVVRAEAAEVLAASRPLVPVASGELARSGFVDGPQLNAGRDGMVATSGYEHPDAGPIHEGVHWGVQKKAPKFLKKALKGANKRFPQRVLVALQNVVSRNAR